MIDKGCKANLVKHDIGSMPGREKDGTVGTVSCPLGVWVACDTVPGDIGKTMDTSNLEEGLDVILGRLRRHSLWNSDQQVSL